MSKPFTDRLRRIQEDKRSVLCVGLDPDPEFMPEHLLSAYPLPDAVLAFNRGIIEATAHAACSFKVNLAFFEVLGREGWRVLDETIRFVPEDAIVIADAKRGDIGNSARFYAKAIFEELQCDAVTVAPYMGTDSVQPFLEYEDTAAFILARTSNPGAQDFQERDLDGAPLYRRVAESANGWDAKAIAAAGLVVGATSGTALRELREACPTLPFLIPGVGAQGGDADAVMKHAATADGLVLVNSSRGILYASRGADFLSAAAREAEQLRTSLEAARA